MIQIEGHQIIKPCSHSLSIIGELLRGGPHFKYGVVDNNGRIIIPMSFISIHEEVGKYFRVRRLSDDKTALLDMNGNVVIDYGQYQVFWSFWGSYIKVRQNRLYGLLDQNLNIALPCKYSNMFECIDGPHRNCYGIKHNQNDCWHFLDKYTLRQIQ